VPDQVVELGRARRLLAEQREDEGDGGMRGFAG
jgi:hypothetical protein